MTAQQPFESMFCRVYELVHGLKFLSPSISQQKFESLNFSKPFSKFNREGWTGGASDIVNAAESSAEDPMAAGGLVSNLPHPGPRVNKTKQHTQESKKLTNYMPAPASTCRVLTIHWQVRGLCRCRWYACGFCLCRGFTSLPTQEAEYSFLGFIPINKQTNKAHQHCDLFYPLVGDLIGSAITGN